MKLTTWFKIAKCVYILGVVIMFAGMIMSLGTYAVDHSNDCYIIITIGLAMFAIGIFWASELCSKSIDDSKAQYTEMAAKIKTAKLNAAEIRIMLGIMDKMSDEQLENIARLLSVIEKESDNAIQ